MATINDLRTAFETAVATVSNINTYKFGFEYDLNSQKDMAYPLCLVVATRSDIPSWTKAEENYQAKMILYDLYNRDDERNMTEVWSNLKSWGFDVLDAMVPRTQTTYRLDSNVQLDVLPYQGNDRLMAAVFQFTLTAKDCRNRS